MPDRQPVRQTMAIDTAIGKLLIVSDHGEIVRVTWLEPGAEPEAPGPATPLLQEAARQLAAYADGACQVFDLPVRLTGSPFQQAVWEQMRAIPYGETKTYGELAANLVSSPRAVGRACGANPVPIIVPCHRVMGQSGKLTGFSGGRGVTTKAHLLELERRHYASPGGGLPLFASLPA